MFSDPSGHWWWSKSDSSDEESSSSNSSNSGNSSGGFSLTLSYETGSNFAAGMGDSISLSGTYWIREGLGWNDYVNFNSTAYQLGNIAGAIWHAGLPVATQYDKTMSNKSVGTTSKPELNLQLFSNKSTYSKGESVNLSRFTTEKILEGKKFLLDPKTKQYIMKDIGKNSGTGGHGGSAWKLFSKSNERIGTISEDGRWLRK